MRAAEQARTAYLNKIIVERRLKILMGKWMMDVIGDYNIGNTMVMPDNVASLQEILKRFYNETAKLVLGFDIRMHKAAKQTVSEEAYGQISRVLGNLFVGRSSAAARNISQTTGGFARQTTIFANQENMTTIGARGMLGNYLRNHALSVAMSESQWTIEATRAVVLFQINDVMKKNSDIVVSLLETGQINEAVEKSKEFLKLDKLPLSEPQEDLMNVIIDNTKKIVDPIDDREDIESIKDEADKLGYTIRRWTTMGDGKVRESHQQVDGQERGLDEPFDLPGGKLRWPGDNGLGASLAETINCRCSEVFVGAENGD